ncbi:MAG: hypothetical protein OEU76_05325 [Cyclobacteriaceae bacterium]|nr:hypothetical protein [Cyclobacteriaceae bacterium]
MDLKALDKALQEIVDFRSELEKLDYSNPKYDEMEENLHDLEDKFQVNYGEYMEGILQNVHDEYCPESDVLLPIAYLGEGVHVDLEKFPGSNVKLALESNPPRLFLKAKDKRQLVWEAK